MVFELFKVKICVKAADIPNMNEYIYKEQL